MEEIVVIPARGFALAFDPRLNGFVLTQERYRQAIEQRQVFGPVAVALPHPVLIEGDVQRPMQPVLDPPVPAASPGHAPDATIASVAGATKVSRVSLRPWPSSTSRWWRSLRSGPPFSSCSRK